MKKLVSILCVAVLLVFSTTAKSSVNHKSTVTHKHSIIKYIKIKRLITPYLPGITQNDQYAILGDISGSTCTFTLYYVTSVYTQTDSPTTITVYAHTDVDNITGTILKRSSTGTASVTTTNPSSLVLDSCTPTSFDGTNIGVQQ